MDDSRTARRCWPAWCGRSRSRPSGSPRRPWCRRSASGNSIYVNGRRLAEPYLPHDDPLGPPIASRQHPYRVPPGEFYLLGDNRADSCDSRYWGPVTGSSIMGKVVLTFWHDGHPDLRWF